MIVAKSSPIRWGDVATWVSGTATLLLVLLALWQLRIIRTQSKDALLRADTAIAQTQRIEVRQIEFDERRQAARVACLSRYDGPHLRVDVWNHSDSPIYDLRVFVRRSDTSNLNEAAQVLLPAATDFLENDASGLNRVPPPGQFSGILFRDNAGAEWIKWGDGVLRQGGDGVLWSLSPSDAVLVAGQDRRFLK